MSFLKKIDLLESKLSGESAEILEKGLKYCKVFKSFHKVVDSCFGNELKSDFKSNIANFKKDYMELGITITPKV